VIVLDLEEIFKMGLDTIKSHKLRSMLTALGILIGVSAVLMNVSMVEGFDHYFRDEVLDIGGNMIQVQAEGEPGDERYFDDHLFNSLERQPHVEGATAYRTTGAVMDHGREEENVLVRGIEENYFDVTDTEIKEGSSISPTDDNTIVIDSNLAKYTFDRPLGVRSTVSLSFYVNGEERTQDFRVRGISEAGSGMMGFGFGGGAVNIPISTFNEIMEEDGYSSVEIYAESSEAVDTVKWNTMEIIDRQWGLEPIRESEIEEEEDTDPMYGGDFDRMLGERDEYSIITAQEILEFTDEITSMIGLVFIGIASVSLLVGGIGISNIMLVTVKERTREIGVMKAVGAQNRHILMTFLLEAGLLGLLGGAAGLVISVIATNTILPMILGIPGILPPEWIVIALGLSFMIGVLSGLYPAWSAAKMDPVNALSYE